MQPTVEAQYPSNNKSFLMQFLREFFKKKSSFSRCYCAGLIHTVQLILLWSLI